MSVSSADALASDRRDRLHRPLVRLARGDRRHCDEVYDLSVEPVLRLALARVQGDRARAEELVCRTYREVTRRAAEYPLSGMRPLTWVLGIAGSVAV